MTQNIVYEIRDNNIGIITLNRPNNANALSTTLLEEFQQQLSEIYHDEAIRALIITGAGTRVFCAGADLKERKSMTDQQVIETVQLIGDTMNRVEAIPVPTIAALNGVAFGGGLELALSCDIRMAKANTSVGLTETSLGIIPGAGGTQRLSNLVGIGQAKKMIFTAKPIDCDEAKEIGLIETIVEADDILHAALDMASTFANNAPIAMKLAKKAIVKGTELPLKEGLQLEHTYYQQTIETTDRMEGLEAFAEKRKPTYVGK